MRPIRSISVLMPTWQGIEFLERVLDALAAQECELDWDVWVIDSGSTDGTLELLERTAPSFPVPFHVARIQQVEFDHGDTRNQLAALSAGDLCVFLTQDAIPIGADWLSRLVANFDEPAVGAAYCRNVPRRDARVLTVIASATDPGYATESARVRLPARDEYDALGPHERRLLYNFNDVASAVRRELWELHPFPRTSFGEDILMSRALLEAGFEIAYDADAAVEHSHDYDEQDTYARAFIDGRFNAEWLDRTCVGSAADVEALVTRTMRSDATAIGALGLTRAQELALLDQAEALRRAAFRGLYDGGETSRRRASTAVLDSPELNVLFVVHGFPPDTWAGTEVYTKNLATEMATLGHRVTILTRAPARSADDRDFDVFEDEFDGLRVLRMVHRLEHRSMAESYRQPRAEAAFRKVLLAERPDIVHFQHLIHTSVGLVDIAKRLGLPTVVTCHDYWALCARVQLIRPDGQRCPTNMGSGCYLCVKETGLGSIERAGRLDAAGGGILASYAQELAAEAGSPASLRRRAQEYIDLRAREEVVPAAYAACDLRISPSQFLRDKYLETDRFDPHTFLFSDNGMRTDHVTALTKEPDAEGRVRFGFVGSLVWYKGGEVLVRAMNRLAGRNCTLSIHGDFRPDEDAHHEELAELARGEDIQFHGRFDNAKLSEVYAEIDVLVVPSIWFENSPITIHEAFLTRTPVLASDIGGMAEFVRDGVDGLHFAVGNDADLASQMERFLDEPDLLERLSKDFPEVKTIADNARETEYRYRALCCQRRAAAQAATGVLLQLSGRDASRREGPVEEQGGDMLLLRPGGAAVEYELEAVGPNDRGPEPVELAVGVFALAGEPLTEHGGRVLLDGAEIGRIPLFRADGDDRVHEFTFPLQPSASARRLRLVTAFEQNGPEASLRVASVVVREKRARNGSAESAK